MSAEPPTGLIRKKGVKPGLIALLNVLPLGVPVGYFQLGQNRKAAVGWAAVWLLLPIGGLGWFLSLVFAYDGYRLAQRLATGEPVGVDECAVDVLRWLPGFGWHDDHGPR